MRQILLLSLFLFSCESDDAAPDDGRADAGPPSPSSVAFIVGTAQLRAVEGPAIPQLQPDPFGTGPVWRFGGGTSRLMAAIPSWSRCRIREARFQYNKGYFSPSAFGAMMYRRSGLALPSIIAAFEDGSPGGGENKTATLVPSYTPTEGEEIYLIISGSSPAQSIAYVSGLADCDIF